MSTNPVSLHDSASVAAGATSTGPWVNVVDLKGGTTYLRVTNGASGPTTRPVVTVEKASDASGTNTRAVYNATTATANNEVTDLIHHHDRSNRYIRAKIVNGATNAVTFEAHHEPNKE